MNKPFYLNGRWEHSDSTREIVNPWSGEVVAPVCLATAQHVEEAVASAAKAAKEARKIPSAARSACLLRIAEGIRVRKEEFVALIIAEAGKPRQAAKVEVARGIISFEHAAHEAATTQGQVLDLEATGPGRHHLGLVQRFPLGVILGIAPFNFPLNLVAHKIAPALATGNAMILKPALKTPLTALLLAEVLHEANVPPGQIQVMAFSHELIPALLRDPRIKMLSFTGSAAIGWKLKAEAAKMKVTLELGGNAAVVIEPDADWESAIPKIAAGAFGYAGQSCISVQRIFIQASLYADFRRKFIAYVDAQIRTGDPQSAATVVGPMIDGAAREKVVRWIHEAEEAGAVLLTPLRQEGRSVLHPVVVENAPATCALVAEEVFAPVVILAPYESFSDALALVNASRYGLQAGVFTSNINKALLAFEELEVGGVLINQVPTFRVENMPYGGVKESGQGREGIRYAMDDMTESRCLIINQE